MEPLAGSSLPLSFDYLSLFDPEFASTVATARSIDVIELYSGSDNFDYKYKFEKSGRSLEYIKLNDDVLVVMSEANPGYQGSSLQDISGGDWLHIQFRVAGGGGEGLEKDSLVMTPDGHCAAIRNPNNSTIIREFAPGAKWKALCIYMRPSAIQSFFGISSKTFANGLDWLSDPGDLPLRAFVTPMPLRALRAIEDLFECNYSGEIRRTFVRAKVLELFSIIASNFCSSSAVDSGATRISASERQRIDVVVEIMKREIETPISLKTLARRVGMNRTKLAELFRECKGTTVQAYWRDLRLVHARDMLAAERLSVTEVAARVGYSNISSLTRAFSRRFGVLPKDFRGSR